jgi:hypothetical protein
MFACCETKPMQFQYHFDRIFQIRRKPILPGAMGDTQAEDMKNMTLSQLKQRIADLEFELAAAKKIRDATVDRLREFMIR